MLKRDELFPYLIISIFLHITVLYFVFHIKERPIFLFAPIEVSFYSPSQNRTDQFSTAFFQEKIESDIVPMQQNKSKKEFETKEDIVVKKKELSRKKLKPQTKTGTKKVDKQLTKLVKEKKLEKSRTADNNSKVETFQSSSSDDKLPVKIASQYEGLYFDTQDFKYLYYSGQIIKKIKREWRWSESYGKLRALVYFKIHRDGTTSDISIKESSGNNMYDRNALDTIRRADTFADLPEGYEKDSLGVFFEFKYNK
ncbi:MAG: TonB family protein [Endomicrobium sp.]|jgi:TonB family protein|nr:TonB family protein [Endomicrobium sp.]